jgi:hypothetical protein
MELLNQPDRLTASVFAERRAFTGEERRILTAMRNKKLIFYGGAYTTFTGILIYAWFYGNMRSYRFGEDEVERYSYVAPILISFFFIVLTIYFLRLYLQNLHPLLKDLKAGEKELIFFQPAPYKTPFFEQYYISNVPYRKKMLQVDKGFYELAIQGEQGRISIAPHSRFVFILKIGDLKIEFSEKNTALDI